jgi:hypothetical protein
MEQLVPQPVIVKAGGEALTLSPLTIGELPAFARAVQPLAGALAAPEPDWLGLIASQGEQLLAALALAVRRERAFIDALPADEAIALAAAALEVNADFFVRRILPAINRLTAALPRVAEAGSTSSSSSSPTATASPAS